MDHLTQEAIECFQRIGVMLKAAREERGLSIQEIATFTRINHNFLDSIEKGDLSSLPGLAFVMGFLRNYTQALALGDDAIKAEIDLLSQMNRPEHRKAELRPTNPDLLDQEPARFSFGMVVIGLVLLTALAGGVYFFFVSGPSDPALVQPAQPTEQPATGAQPAPGSEAANPAGPAQPPQGQNATTTPPATQAATTPGPVEGRQRLELTLRGLERTWVRLSVDRAPPVDVMLEPADTLSWDADQEFVISIGKSHGVSMYLNGEEFMLPQEKNRLVENLTLNRVTLLRMEN